MMKRATLFIFMVSMPLTAETLRLTHLARMHAHRGVTHHRRIGMCVQSDRPVRLGMKDLVWPFATHWAVQVHDKWYEVRGASKEDTNTTMAITTSHHPAKSASGADVSRFGHVGETSKSDDEINDWVAEWTARNPTYFLGSANCQRFSREFIAWLTDEAHKPLPMMDAGMGANRAVGARTWAGAERGSAYAGATVANMQGHRGLLNGELDAPNAAAAALCNKDGFGAFAEAELARVEGGFGPIRVAGHVNVNTCVGFRNKGLEVSVAGFGFKAGANGVSVSSPLLTVGVGRRT